MIKSNKNIYTGQLGERLAVEYLLKNNYEILVRNKKISYQEIDIIAKNKEKTVFIEVKTRTRLEYGGAEEAIDSKKIKNIQKAIFSYCREHKLCEDDVDIEVITVYLNNQNNIANIRHYKEVL